MKSEFKEFSITAPWGKIALVAWGNPDNSPVLLVHGRQDSCATFIPLLEYLPDEFYYVGLDLPGHGKSEPFPVGVQLLRQHFIVAIDIVIKHLKWINFIYMAHSMGCEQGLFLNAIHPGLITKFIFLDANPAWQRLQVHDFQKYFRYFYESYYNNYEKNIKDERVYSKRQALDAVMRARDLSEEEAELVLSRNLVAIGDDQYKLSWDRRLKLLAPPNYPPKYYYNLFSENLPPTLLISASSSSGYSQGKIHVDKMVENLRKNVKNFNLITVKGGHDVHLTNPERLNKYICDFLINYKAKL